MGRLEQDYREALDLLCFSGAGKERIMKNLMQAEKRTVKGKYLRPARAALIAAALCLALVGTALAVHYFGMTMVEARLFTDRKATQGEDWDEQFLSYKFHDGTQVNRDTYTASNGVAAQILEYTCPGDTPTCKAAFSINGIPTIVTVSDSPDVREVLYQVLDGFVLE